MSGGENENVKEKKNQRNACGKYRSKDTSYIIIVFISQLVYLLLVLVLSSLLSYFLVIIITNGRVFAMIMLSQRTKT